MLRVGAAAVTEHSYSIGQAGRAREVDALLTCREPAEREHAQPVLAVGPCRRQAARFERLEVEPWSDDLAQHGGAPERPPRGIRSAVEREFQEHPHEPTVVRPDAPAKRRAAFEAGTRRARTPNA